MTAVQSTRFGSLDIRYDDRVLAPRHWTILQSTWAMELSRALPDGPILELCAGAGHIGLLVAHRTGRPLVQVEADAVAAHFALTNAREAQITDYSVRCALMADAVSRLDRFAIVMADPPYIPSSEVDAFPDDPRNAIDGGPDGLALVRQCLIVSSRVLIDDGVLLLQVRGDAQAREINGLAADEQLGLKVREVRAHDDDRAVALLTHD